MSPEELEIVQGERFNTYSIGHNEYALIHSNMDDLTPKLEELERQILIMMERLDKLNIDADELGVLKEQVSLLDLLKSDIESS